MSDLANILKISGTRPWHRFGAWLKVNGEAIYRTRPWTRSEEGKVHFTRRDDTLYALALDWPDAERRLASLGKEVGEITLIELLAAADPEMLTFRQNVEGLIVTLPARSVGEHAFAFRIGGLKLPPAP